MTGVLRWAGLVTVAVLTTSGAATVIHLGAHEHDRRRHHPKDT
jgi:hypothetical protein